MKSTNFLWSLFPHLPWPYHLVDRLIPPLPVPSGLARSSISLPNCTAELTTPAGHDNGKIVVYLHGGAFLFGGRKLHRQMTGRFADELHAQVLAVDYRKLPRATVADALEDSVAGYRYALQQAGRPEDVVLMGDSAGGYLALMTAVEIRRRGMPVPAAIVVMAPLTDWDMTAKMAAPTARTCAVFPQRASTRLLAVAERAAGGQALESPAHCDLTGLPPTLVQVSDSELLYPDAVLIADRLREHGVPCELQVWHRQVHVFQAAASIVPEAAAAVDRISEFLAGWATAEPAQHSA
ncbi:alpha/beta hydrolase [Nocardia stercoris]|uniref:alpha/beta hydrolase n=1 Tax=Nocardia stercoris TaxID=2483361 RepID=UPI001F208D21|nr:alpha/beta hydrolase [Nocardia stercoris]